MSAGLVVFRLAWRQMIGYHWGGQECDPREKGISVFELELKLPREEIRGGFGWMGCHGEQGQMLWSEVRKVEINFGSGRKAGWGERI